MVSNLRRGCQEATESVAVGDQDGSGGRDVVGIVRRVGTLVGRHRRRGRLEKENVEVGINVAAKKATT